MVDEVEIIKIEIVNWDKFNPRKDLKSSSWFRLQNNFCTHPEFFNLTNDHKMVWIYLLSAASEKYSSTVDVNPSLVSALLRIDSKKIYQYLDHFEKRGLIVMTKAHVTSTLRVVTDPKQARDDHERIVSDLHPTNERTNERNEQNERESVEADRLLATRWHAHAISHQPWLKHSVEKFEEGIAKLRKAVGLSSLEADALFEFIAQDEFWKDKAISPASLLKRSSRNDMRKVDNILSQMKKGWDKMRDLHEWTKETSDFDPFQGAK